MSLDVSLIEETEEDGFVCEACKHVHKTTHRNYLYEGNITHNLTKMADEVGLYMPLWRPEEINVTKASELIPLLEAGLLKAVENKESLKLLNPANGWGSYDGLITFTQNYLKACRQFPNAGVYAGR